MAKMVPTPMLPGAVPAEVAFYEGVRGQLDERFVAYHGINWLRLERGQVREEGESDFLIAHPDLGVLVIEVKGGDEFTFDPNSRRWRRRTGSHWKDIPKDPFVQAQQSVHWLLDELRDIPGSDKWMPSVGHAVAFPDGNYDGEAHPAAPEELVIDHRAMIVLATRIPAIMKMHARGGRTFGDQGMRWLHQSLGCRVEVMVSLGTRLDEARVHMHDLTDEQLYVAALLERMPRAGISGTAGSGKSLLALLIARSLARRGKRTLVTCFNKRLAGSMRESLADEANITVSHFHELAYEIVTRDAQPLPVPAENTTADARFFVEDLPEQLALAAETMPDADKFDAIVVDEAQDFRASYWDALMKLHRTPADGPLYLFSDEAQNIYDGVSLPLEPSELLPPLMVNHRNSAEIQTFLAALRGDLDFVPHEDAARTGPVLVQSYADPDAMVKQIAARLDHLIRKDEVDLEDIVLLTPSKAENSAVRGRPELAGIPLSEDVSPGTLLTSSLHGFKGLERQVVLLAELGERGHITDQRAREYLYVGSSRASLHLEIFATPDMAAILSKFPATELSKP